MNLTRRNEFPTLINALALTRGVELGVAKGAFSEHLLSGSRGLHLTSIDKWDDERHGENEALEARERLAKFKDRSHVLRSTFTEAAKTFEDASLDFIYIDGYAHTGQEAGKTLAEWWPKLKPGGVFAGHDYHVRWAKTVNAVNRFALTHRLPIFLTAVDVYPSWYFFKPGGRPMHGGEVVIEGRDDLPVAPGATCILVGNGPSLLKVHRGPQIDAFDEVVRFNDFTLKGREHYTGRKTTVWSTCRGRMPADGQRYERMIYIHGDRGNPVYAPEQLWRIPLDLYDEMRALVRERSKRDDKAKADLLPSTGLVTLAWLLRRGVQTVSLIGFDHFNMNRGGLHHYWRRYVGRAPVEHDGEAEHSIFQEFYNEGRIKVVV